MAFRRRFGRNVADLWLERKVRALRNGSQQLLFPVDQSGGVMAGGLESVAVCDGIRRAGFDAVTAKNAAVVIDAVDLYRLFSEASRNWAGELWTPIRR